MEISYWKTEISRENREQKTKKNTNFRFQISLQFSDFYQLFSEPGHPSKAV